jgi:hypothetical protein
MSSRVANGANGANGARFELPALNLNFGTLTDGTDIPPPPDSPVQKVPTPPQTPPKKTDTDAVKSNDGADKIAAATAAAAPSNGNIAGTKRPAEDVPASTAGTGRQGSLRRLFSRTMLNNSYAEGQTKSSAGDSTSHVAAAAAIERPVSQSAGSYMDERKSKRSSGWFRRLKGGDSSSRRSSVMSEQTAVPSSPLKPKGPPPPMIPELKELEKDEGSLGNDLFKNIK